MKKGFIVIVIAALFFQSCTKLTGEGPVVSETRVVPVFSGIRLKIPAKLNYTPGTDYKVVLQSQQNILNEIETIMAGNDLEFRFRQNNTNIKRGEEIVVNITTPSLSKLEVEGSGTILSQSYFNPASLRIAVNGSGNIRLHNLETPYLDAEITGSGKISLLEGVTENQDLHISGSGDMDFGNFIAKKAIAHISGSGTMKINVAETLDANISGSGRVLYRGDPVVNSIVSGTGSVGRW